MPRLFCARRPFDQTARGFSKRKRLCGPPSPLTRALSLWPTHSPNAAKLGAHPGEQKPGVSPAEDREGSVSLPTPARSVKFPPGEGVGCDVCLRARPRLQNRLPPPSAAKAAHAHTLTTHPCTFTHSNAFNRHTRTDVLPRRGRRWLLAARTFRASRRAGHAGRGAGSREIDNRFGGLQRISLLEAKPHNRTDFGPDDPRESLPIPNWEWVTGSPRLGSPQLQIRGRPEVSQRGTARRALRVESPLNPACLPGNTLALFPLQSPCNPKKRPHKFEGLKEPTANSLINASTLKGKHPCLFTKRSDPKRQYEMRPLRRRSHRG